jgi:hypothetical protein
MDFIHIHDNLSKKFCINDEALNSFIIPNTDLIISDGEDQLQLLIDAGRESRTLTLDSYNASKLSALAYDATTAKLFFSDLRHLHGHIFSVDLDQESPVKDIVESNSFLFFIRKRLLLLLSLFFSPQK